MDSLQRAVEECRDEYKRCKEELKTKAEKSELNQRLVKYEVLCLLDFVS